MKLSPSLIEKLDNFAPPPNQNASKVYNILKEQHGELTNYELQCFAVELLASAVLTQELAYAEPSIKQLTKDFYYAHYYRLSCQLTSDMASIPSDTISDGAIGDSQNDSQKK